MEQDNLIIERIQRIQKKAKGGAPYWLARELMEALDYSDWRVFRQVIERASTASDMAGQFSTNHFVPLPDMVAIGSGAKRQRENFALSKYACSLVAMNGDPIKPEIAVAQSYFVEQTYRQEQQEQISNTERRAILRDRVRDANRKLSGAAKAAGVSGSMFGVFNDEGYKGLYGGRGYQTIKKMKGISPKDDLLDCISRTELAANEFRITQTEEKLRRDGVQGERLAVQTHYKVGREVRQTIETLGGAMPETLPAEPSIKKLKAPATATGDPYEGGQSPVRQLATPYDADPAGASESDKD